MLYTHTPALKVNHKLQILLTASTSEDAFAVSHHKESRSEKLMYTNNLYLEGTMRIAERIFLRSKMKR